MKHAKEVMTDVANKYVQEQSASKNTEKELPELKFLYEGYEVWRLSLICGQLKRLYKQNNCKIPISKLQHRISKYLKLIHTEQMQVWRH